LGEKKRRKNLKKWLNYKFDNAISKGFVAQFILLLVTIALMVLVFGLIVGLISSQINIGHGMWQSLMHIIDQGTISGDELEDGTYIVIMLLVTFLGMAFTGTIVGIINNAMSAKLDSLKKGHSQIIEEGHVVVIGFDENIHTILAELEESNENWTGNKKIVVIGDKDKETMEHSVMEHQRDMGNEGDFIRAKKNKNNIIFRSGNFVSENTYSIASIEKSRAIIINNEDDFTVIRIMLAVVAYLKKHDAYIPDSANAENINNNIKMPAIVTLMHENENLTAAAAIAAGVYHAGKHDKVRVEENNVRVLYFESILAHIFAQVCRQPGLSRVISELFDYANSEIYIEDKAKNGRMLEEDLAGKTFEEISNMCSNSIPIGIQKANKENSDEMLGIQINPNPYTTIFEKGDKLIHLAEDDNELILEFNKERKLIGSPSIEEERVSKPYHYIFFGWSIPLKEIIQNIDVKPISGSTIKVVTNRQEGEQEYTNCPYYKKQEKKTELTIDNVTTKVELLEMDPYDWKQVKVYLNSVNWDDEKERPTNLVIMCQDGLDKTEADEKAAVLLLNIREYLKEKKCDKYVNITTEMNLPEDQILLAHSTANDFIVGSEIANRMMVQVANNPLIYYVFSELLTNKGSEIYLRPFSEYVDISKEFNFNFIQEEARKRAKRGDIHREACLGWIRVDHSNNSATTKLNPVKTEREQIFRLLDDNDSFDNYRLVVLAIDKNVLSE